MAGMPGHCRAHGHLRPPEAATSPCACLLCIGVSLDQDRADVTRRSYLKPPPRPSHAVQEPSWFHGVLGPLASPRIASRTNAGYVLMQHANAAALAEGRQAAVAGSVQALLEARPAALAAFEAAIAGS